MDSQVTIGRGFERLWERICNDYYEYFGRGFAQDFGAKVHCAKDVMIYFGRGFAWIKVIIVTN